MYNTIENILQYNRKYFHPGGKYFNPGGKCFHPGGKSRDTNRAFKYVKRHYEISRVWDKEKIASQFSIGIPIGSSDSQEILSTRVEILSTRVEILSTRVEIEEKNQNVSLKSCNTQGKYKLL